MKRTASAVWYGDLKGGNGVMSTGGGHVKDVPYSFPSRFEEGSGTNPEELIAAAHAGCFAMATSATFAKGGITAERLEVRATVTLETVDGAPTVTGSHLELSARVPGVDAVRFAEITNEAKAGCPISRLLRANITLDAKLVR